MKAVTLREEASPHQHGLSEEAGLRLRGRAAISWAASRSAGPANLSKSLAHDLRHRGHLHSHWNSVQLTFPQVFSGSELAYLHIVTPREGGTPVLKWSP